MSIDAQVMWASRAAFALGVGCVWGASAAAWWAGCAFCFGTLAGVLSIARAANDREARTIVRVREVIRGVENERCEAVERIAQIVGEP